jgi:hypothetical protein
MTRLLSLVLSLLLFAPVASAQDGPKPLSSERVKLQLSDQVEDLLRAIRDGKAEVANAILADWKPSAADIDAVFNAEGKAALGEKVLAVAEETFAGTPEEVGKRLELDTAKVNVTVFAESTEGLESMAHGSHAAMHFASALRSTMRHCNKQLQFYAVMMLEHDAPEDATGSYLQVFCRSGDGFVYLGKVWSLEGESEDGGADEGGSEGEGGE